MSLREWSLLTGRGVTKWLGGGGGGSQVLPVQKGGEGKQVLAMLKGGGNKHFL